MNGSRRTWAEVDLKAIAHNVQQVRRLVGPRVKVLAVVKANAYGHGAPIVSRTVLANGADWLGVATLEEAVQLRREGLAAPILLLGYLPAGQAEEAIRWDIQTTISNFELAETLAAVGRKVGRRVAVHLKIDTGMARLGFLPSREACRTILRLAKLQWLEVAGIYTHFAAAEEEDKGYTYQQLEVFLDFVEQLRRDGLEIPVCHAANSAALVQLPETRLDMVRPGLMLYGVSPAPQLSRIDLRPALSFWSEVSLVKSVGPGVAVSYGCSYITKVPTQLACLAVGYGDGYSRLLSNRGEVIIHSRRVPVVGRVCMDQCLVDVTSLPGEVAVGDEVLLFGMRGDVYLPVEEVAEKSLTIPYEVLCGISGRVPRVYQRG